MRKSRVEAIRGSALVTALCLVLVLLMFSVAFLFLPWQESVLNHRAYCGAVALSLAEAGVEYTCWAISPTGNIADWSGSPKTRTETGFKTYANEAKGDFTIRAWPTPMIPNPIWLVESTGSTEMLIRDSKTSIWRMEPISRTVKALCVPKIFNPFSGAFLADNIVTLGGAITVDSYDTRDGAYGGDNVHRGAPGEADEGKGDISTNSTGDPAVNLGNNITVYGDIQTGEGGVVTPLDFEPVGEISHDFNMELPYNTAPTGLSYAVQPGDGVLSVKKGVVEYAPGNYKFTKLSVKGTLNINGPAVVWVTGVSGTAIEETGSGVIHCVGKVDFYVDANISLAGNGITNSSGLPIDMAIYGSEGCTDIYCGGANAFYGAVYAPNADVKLAGSEDKYGAFVGKTITVQGGTDYHYDEALGELDLHGGQYMLRYWQEM